MTAVLQKDSAEALQHPPAVSCSSDATATIPSLIPYQFVHGDLLQTGLLLAQWIVQSRAHWSDLNTGVISWERPQLWRHLVGQVGSAWTE